MLLTASIDLPVWPAVLLFVIRAQLRREPRWWLAAGLVVGLSTYNKLLIVVLLLAMAGGIVLVEPRRVLWCRWVLAGLALALVVGLPNLIYQATHSWPQPDIGRGLAAKNAGEVHGVMWPFLAVFAAGCVPTWQWVLGSMPWRRPTVVAAVALNVAASAIIALPLIPASALGATPVPGNLSGQGASRERGEEQGVASPPPVG